MNTRTWMLIGALLAVAAPGWTAEPAAAKPDRPVLSLQAPEVQKVIRAVAKASPDATELKPASAVTLGDQVTIPFRAPRRPHHMECDNISCVAYTADDVALYTVPREQYYGERAPGVNAADEWLSCQSRDNLLSTFQRYDKCRGITVGLPPLALGDTLIAAPGLRIR
jgi:hypothetical protein